MDFDFLDRSFVSAARKAIFNFRDALERARPAESELRSLCAGIQPYQHTTELNQNFLVAGIDGSGEYPILQQDDIFVHFVVASAGVYKTETERQHKLASSNFPDKLFKTFAVLKENRSSISESYDHFLFELLGLSVKELVLGSDYCEVFSRFGKKIGPKDISWASLALAKASQIATHAYQLRSLAELAMAARVLSVSPKYILLDTTLVYFLLGETPYLPELLKRYLIARAYQCGTCIVGLSKSHNIPNGDLIGRWAREKVGFKDHWFLRLPSPSLGEQPFQFLREREIPPKLCVSYLFKFHATSFPLRIDLDAVWWKTQIGGDPTAESKFFEEMDFLCHDVRSYGYPYPLHAAHRSASLTKKEKNTVRDILLQHAQTEGILRGAFLRGPEEFHQEGI